MDTKVKEYSGQRVEEAGTLVQNIVQQIDGGAVVVYDAAVKAVTGVGIACDDAPASDKKSEQLREEQTENTSSMLEGEMKAIVTVQDMEIATYQEPLQMVAEGKVQIQFQQNQEVQECTNASITNFNTSKSSPMEALHALVSHKVEQLQTKDQNKENQKLEVGDSEYLEEIEKGENHSNLVQVCKGAGLSPKLCTKGRKGKANGDNNCILPTRVQARRVAKTVSK
ncbi:hypothetical protein KY285_000323 [Solanum tuberosum]|nr:hypothetical protein KY284_000362 [Solanum tuberosum]KAH0764452.1 hypothetical protein KY285_000323 [Solanum tuberosum]